MRLVVTCLLAAVAFGLQDPTRGTQDPARGTQDPEPRPVRAEAPPDAAPLEPYVDPPWLAVTRHDLIQRFTPPGPLEGTWRVRRVVESGRTAVGASGYMIAGPRVLMLQLRLPESGGGQSVQASTRTYRIRDGVLETSTLIGHATFGGKMRAEAPGRVELRRLEFIGGVVRVARTGGSFVEFERIE